MSDQIAIRLDNACKHYGGGKKKTPVLLGLDMEVKKGQIYGLLGKTLGIDFATITKLFSMMA